MNKLKLLLLLGVCLLALGALAGCAKNPTLEERGYTIAVTYDYNGGSVDSQTQRVLYYKENQPLLPPGESVEFKEPGLDNFHALSGWYRALTDENGEVLRDDAGAILTEDTPFVFEGARAEQSCTLVARWVEKPTFEIEIPGADPFLYPVDAGRSITERLLVMAMNDRAPVENKTFYGFFTDSGCTERAVFPMELAAGTRLTLYPKWLDGDVLIVRTRNDFAQISLYLGKTVYLDADIDMEGHGLPTLSSFGGKFLGNGHVIKNLTQTANLTGRTANWGLFGELTDGAEIRNVTFENARVTVAAPYSQQRIFRVGFLAHTVRGNVTVSDVAFRDCTLSLTLPEGAFLNDDVPEDADYLGVLAGVAEDAALTYERNGSVPLSTGNGAE